MSVVALTAVETPIANNVTYVSSAQTFPVKAFLASDFAFDAVVRFEATDVGQIEVVTSTGRRIGFVPGESSAIATLTDLGTWQFSPLPAAPAALVANATDLATCQTLANALKVILQNAGLMKAE